MFESRKFDSTEKRMEDDKKYRRELKDEIRGESDHEKRGDVLFQKQKEREYFASFEVAKLRHNVYAKTRGQFAPERLDMITSLIEDEIGEEQKSELMKTALDELVFEMAEYKPEIWQEKLDTYLEGSLEKRGRMVQKINAYILDQDNLDRKLRNHQLGALVKIRDFIEEGFLRGYVAHPTGAGKTMLFSSLVQATDARTMIVVPTKLLVKQTLLELRKNMKDKKLSYISTTKEKDMNKDKKIKLNAQKGTGGDIVVITNQSLKFDTEAIRGQHFDMIIVDEAHNSYTAIAQHALRHFPDAIKLAFTATPDYYYAEDAPGFLEKDFDGNKLYLDPEKSAARYYPHEIDRIGLREAIEMKMLTDLCAAVVRMDINLDEVKTNQTKNGVDFNEQDLNREIEKHWPTLKKQVIETYFEGIKSSDGESEDVLKFNDKQIFAVCSSVKQAEDLAGEFCEKGVKAACITGETPDDEREDLFEKYRNKEIQILTSVSVLKEGWDMPEAEVCLMLRPTLSRTFYEQVLGRVLRLDPNNPEKVALVVDFLGKYERMTPMTTPGMFGMEEFYNGQFIVPKKIKREDGEAKDVEEDDDKQSYNVSSILQKIERVEKVSMISDDLLKLGNNIYANRKFLEEKFFVKPERLRGFLENNVIATTKVGKATFADLKDVMRSFIRKGEVLLSNTDYASLREISELIRFKKGYISFIADKNNISRYWEADAYNNKYEAYETGPLWRAIEKDLKEKLNELKNFKADGIEKTAESEPIRQKRIKIERNESLVLTADALSALKLNSVGDILQVLNHVANQKGSVGVKKRLGMIYISRELSEEEVVSMEDAIGQIKDRTDFKRDREIAGECGRILNDIQKRKGAAQL